MAFLAKEKGSSSYASHGQENRKPYSMSEIAFSNLYVTHAARCSLDFPSNTYLFHYDTDRFNNFLLNLHKVCDSFLEKCLDGISNDKYPASRFAWNASELSGIRHSMWTEKLIAPFLSRARGDAIEFIIKNRSECVGIIADLLFYNTVILAAGDANKSYTRCILYPPSSEDLLSISFTTFVWNPKRNDYVFNIETIGKEGKIYLDGRHYNSQEINWESKNVRWVINT